MRTARWLSAVILGVAFLSLASPSEAAQGSNCPRGFQLAPVSVLGDDFTGVADNVNHDGFICIKDLSPTFGIFIDNNTR